MRVGWLAATQFRELRNARAACGAMSGPLLLGRRERLRGVRIKFGFTCGILACRSLAIRYILRAARSAKCKRYLFTHHQCAFTQNPLPSGIPKPISKLSMMRRPRRGRNFDACPAGWIPFIHLRTNVVREVRTDLSPAKWRPNGWSHSGLIPN